MHSRIFVLSTPEEVEEYNFDLPWDNETVCQILGIDYVNRESPEETRQSIKWLEEVYQIKCKEKQIKDLTVYEIPLDQLLKLKKALEKEKIKRIEKVKEIINSQPPEKINPYNLASTLYNQKGFFFAYEYTIINEMDLLEELQFKKETNLLETFPNIIAETYDYHF